MSITWVLFEKNKITYSSELSVHHEAHAPNLSQANWEASHPWWGGCPSNSFYLFIVTETRQQKSGQSEEEIITHLAR